MIHPIRTQAGSYISVDSIPGLGVVLEQSWDAHEERIRLDIDAAYQLRDQLDLAITAAELGIHLGRDQ